MKNTKTCWLAGEKQINSKSTGLSNTNTAKDQATVHKPLFENLLVDRNGIAEVLSLAPSTISKLMVYDGLPYYKIGKACRFKVSEVMAFLEKRKQQ